jgi:small subunit ribosomal protein S20
MAKEKEPEKKVKLPTAKKRDLQSEKRRVRNRAYKSEVNSVVRSFTDALGKGDAATQKKALSEIFSTVDRGVKKGKLKLNKASRIKARLAKRVSAVA